jgi:1-acyl-sn-glycerol-3-phosphate acyltransferase
LDRPALAQARGALAQGRYPLVVAPEGATNNLSGEMAPLEPGVAQLAFWAAEDLEKAGDTRQLEVLPVGIHYSWRKHNWKALDVRLAALEYHLGISSARDRSEDPETARRDRLIQIGMNLLSALEQLERLKPDPEFWRTDWGLSPAWPGQGRGPFRPACRRQSAGALSPD